MAITKATASSIAPAAKGDLVVGSGTNDAAVLAVGTNDYVLTADSSTTTGLKWAAAASSVPYTAWTAYTPTWNSSSGVVGNATNQGYYTRVGDLVYVYARLVWGSTTTLASSAYLRIGYPSGLTSRQSGSGIPFVGTTWYYDVSTAAEAQGMATQHSTTEARTYYLKADQTNVYDTGVDVGGNPWVFATGDELIMWAIYTTDAA